MPNRAAGPANGSVSALKRSGANLRALTEPSSFDLSPFAFPQIVLVLGVIVSPFTVPHSGFGICVNLNLQNLTCPSFAFRSPFAVHRSPFSAELLKSYSSSSSCSSSK
jgi:hypothetical protein